jgi:cell division septation protein DedD
MTTSKGLLSTPVSAPKLDPLNGYSIQVAASPETVSQEKLTPYAALSKYGNLYVKKENGLNKVRLGIYPTKDEADKNLKDMTKQRKYVSAFVVEERGADQSLVLGPPPAKPAALAATAPTLAPATTAKGLSSNALVRYSVQLASFALDKPVNINDYAGISKFGNVYTRNENGMTKVRVGVFSEHADAETVRNQAVKEGFKDPMVVTEKADDPAIQSFLQPSISKPALAIAPKAQQLTAKGNLSQPAALAAPKTTPVTNPKYPYYVKIAALSRPDLFDEKPLDNLGGAVEKRPTDKGLTNILLGGYPDLASANQAKARAKGKGYEGAFVVKDVNGQLIRQ